MKKQILYMVCATALLSSCHIYKSYDRPEDITTSGLYRDPIAENDTLVSDTTNFGNLPWIEVFTDPQLQSLIEAGLKQNTDLLTAAQNVKAAEASLCRHAWLMLRPWDCLRKEQSAALTRMQLPKPIHCPSLPAGKSTYSGSC